MPGLLDDSGRLSERLSDVLSVFDPTFFISGASVVSAGLVFLHTTDEMNLLNFSPSYQITIAILFLTYISGQVCFALSTTLRSLVSWLLSGKHLGRFCGFSTDELLRSQLGQCLPQNVGEETAVHSNTTSTLYNYLWAWLRDNDGHRESRFLLNRYWTLSGTCRSLAVSLIVWWPVLTLVGRRYVTPVAPAGMRFLCSWWVIGILLVIAAICLLWTACEFKKHQIREIAATYVQARKHQKQGGSEATISE